MSDSSTEPTVAEVEASEISDVPTVAVIVSTPVRTQDLPATTGEMGSRDGIGTDPIKLFDADPRRKSLTLIAKTNPMLVARSQQECSARGAEWPIAVPLVLTHKEAVYVAAQTATIKVSWDHELWTD